MEIFGRKIFNILDLPWLMVKKDQILNPYLLEAPMHNIVVFANYILHILELEIHQLFQNLT